MRNRQVLCFVVLLACIVFYSAFFLLNWQQKPQVPSVEIVYKEKIVTLPCTENGNKLLLFYRTGPNDKKANFYMAQGSNFGRHHACFNIEGKTLNFIMYCEPDTMNCEEFDSRPKGTFTTLSDTFFKYDDMVFDLSNTFIWQEDKSPNMKIISIAGHMNEGSNILSNILIPQPLFGGWIATARYLREEYTSFDDLCKKYMEIGSKPAKHIKLGWIGSVSYHPCRKVLLDRVDAITSEESKQYLDVYNSQRGSQWLTFSGMMMNYQFLLDVEGRGYSARLLMFFWSNRTIFIQDRHSTEYWMKDLIPWKHFIPIKRDFSDLEEKVLWAVKNVNYALKIASGGLEFAKQHLTTEKAMQRWHQVLLDVKKDGGFSSCEFFPNRPQEYGSGECDANSNGHNWDMKIPSNEFFE